MHQKTLAKLRRALDTKEVSSVELCQHFLKRIQSLDEKTNAFISVSEAHALAQAEAADQRIASGDSQWLTGIPYAHKDIFCTKGIKTSCGSKMLDNFIAPYDATVSDKLNQAGAVMLGKANMDEFAMGSCNETSFYGHCMNPWDLQTTPGGSSGGSAAAVAARLAPAATGTDTGGSIRQPAGFCGLTGLKPTYGRVSRYGMVAFASSLDQGGPITQTAEDAAMMLNVMAGFDEKDSTSAEQAVPNYTSTLNDSIKGLKIGIPKQYFTDQLGANIANPIDEARKQLEALGATCIDVDLPHTDYATSAYYIIAPAECSANLSRFDGVRYGYRCDQPTDLNDLYIRSRSEGFGEEVKRRIMIGTYVLSAGFYDAYYRKASQARRLIKQDFVDAFKQVDVILAPTTPNTAFKLGSITDPVSLYLSDIFTIPVNLAGLPSISIPVGFSNNLPVGMQLIGNHFEEATILRAAHQYQQHTDWHQRLPEGF